MSLLVRARLRAKLAADFESGSTAGLTGTSPTPPLTKKPTMVNPSPNGVKKLTYSPNEYFSPIRRPSSIWNDLKHKAWYGGRMLQNQVGSWIAGRRPDMLHPSTGAPLSGGVRRPASPQPQITLESARAFMQEEYKRRQKAEDLARSQWRDAVMARRKLYSEQAPPSEPIGPLRTRTNRITYR